MKYDPKHVVAAGVSNGGIMAVPTASRYSVYTHAMLIHARCGHPIRCDNITRIPQTKNSHYFSIHPDPTFNVFVHTIYLHVNSRVEVIGLRPVSLAVQFQAQHDRHE